MDSAIWTTGVSYGELLLTAIRADTFILLSIMGAFWCLGRRYHHIFFLLHLRLRSSALTKIVALGLRPTLGIYAFDKSLHYLGTTWRLSMMGIFLFHLNVFGGSACWT